MRKKLREGNLWKIAENRGEILQVIKVDQIILAQMG